MKKDYTFLIAAGCVARSVKLYCVLVCFVENFNILTCIIMVQRLTAFLSARAAKRCFQHSSTFSVFTSP